MKPATVRYAAGVAARNLAFWTSAAPDRVTIRDRIDLAEAIAQFRPLRIAVATSEWPALYSTLSPARFSVRAASPVAVRRHFSLGGSRAESRAFAAYLFGGAVIQNNDDRALAALLARYALEAGQ